MKDILVTILAILTFLAVLFLVSVLMALPVMWLWNFIMPAIFGLTEIIWIQAVALNLLCGFLFKSSTVATKNSERR